MSTQVPDTSLGFCLFWSSPEAGFPTRLLPRMSAALLPSKGPACKTQPSLSTVQSLPNILYPTLEYSRSKNTDINSFCGLLPSSCACLRNNCSCYALGFLSPFFLRRKIIVLHKKKNRIIKAINTLASNAPCYYFSCWWSMCKFCTKTLALFVKTNKQKEQIHGLLFIHLLSTYFIADCMYAQHIHKE